MSCKNTVPAAKSDLGPLGCFANCSCPPPSHHLQSLPTPAQQLLNTNQSVDPLHTSASILSQALSFAELLFPRPILLTLHGSFRGTESHSVCEEVNVESFELHWTLPGTPKSNHFSVQIGRVKYNQTLNNENCTQQNYPLWSASNEFPLLKGYFCLPFHSPPNPAF